MRWPNYWPSFDVPIAGKSLPKSGQNLLPSRFSFFSQLHWQVNLPVTRFKAQDLVIEPGELLCQLRRTRWKLCCKTFDSEFAVY